MLSATANIELWQYQAARLRRLFDMEAAKTDPDRACLARLIDLHYFLQLKLHEADYNLPIDYLTDPWNMCPACNGNGVVVVGWDSAHRRSGVWAPRPVEVMCRKCMGAGEVFPEEETPPKRG